MKIAEYMKKIALETQGASKPTVVQFGTIISSNPLEVNVDQRFTLSEDFLIVPEQLTEYKITIDGTEYAIRKGLVAGDKVMLLRVQGGQLYVILDRVV